MPDLRGKFSPFVEELSPFLKEVHGADYTPWPSIAGRVLNMDSMDAAHVDVGTKSKLGPMAVKDEIGTQAEDSKLIGPQVRSTAVEYGKKVVLSRLAVDDTRTFEEASKMIASDASDIRESADNTKETALLMINRETGKGGSHLLHFLSGHTGAHQVQR